jgi:hypothetical protein
VRHRSSPPLVTISTPGIRELRAVWAQGVG